MNIEHEQFPRTQTRETKRFSSRRAFAILEYNGHCAISYRRFLRWLPPTTPTTTATMCVENVEIAVISIAHFFILVI